MLFSADPQHYKENMKRNLMRLAAVGTVIIAIGLYLHWNDKRLNDGSVPQKITCMNNMAMIGLAFRFWESDHSDRSPVQRQH